MTKTLTLKTISFKQRRAKFEGDVWLTLSPFISLDNLKFDQSYILDVVMDSNNLWYVNSMLPVAGLVENEAK
jgi:hypothetical protein